MTCSESSREVFRYTRLTFSGSDLLLKIVTNVHQIFYRLLDRTANHVIVKSAKISLIGKRGNITGSILLLPKGRINMPITLSMIHKKLGMEAETTRLD